jgi:hypothetical protein
VAVTDELDPSVDPCAVAFASRESEEPYFCLEQPDRGGAALSALGTAATLEAHGPSRFRVVADRWRDLVSDARADDPGRAPGTGLVAVGGFAFAPEGGASEAWSGFAAASLHVPQVALARRDGQVHVTLATRVAGDDLADQVVAAMQARLGRLRRRPLPLLDPEPLARRRVGGALAPEHYEAAVPPSASEPETSRRWCSLARSPSTPGPTSTPPPSSACCATPLPPALPSAWGGDRRHSWPPAPSC